VQEAPTTPNLVAGFVESARRFPQRAALEVADQALTYEGLYDRASRLAATLIATTPATAPPLVAVFASRSTVAFTGVLAALFRGHGYVPLNPAFPIQRTREMLVRSESRVVVVGEEAIDQLPELLDGIEDALTLVLPTDGPDIASLSARWPMHTVVRAEDAIESADPVLTVPRDALAYLLFTSGSTGKPKAVMVAHRNVTAFLSFAAARYRLTEHDRLSQTFDLTFDLSVFDMFVAWQCGACLCCPAAKTLLNPHAFISGAKLTVWFSVPSVGVFLHQLGALEPGRFPSLRWSLFCGEPLPATIADAWTVAAPNSTLENLYGPTELTIACMYYRWDAERSPELCRLGVVPIGEPFPTMQARVIDTTLREVPPGGEGELALSGPQITLGYWRDAERTAERFVELPGETQRYYLTGDRVTRPRGAEPMCFLGRVDDQIKVLGHRVELGEIEDALRSLTGTTAIAAVGWPQGAGGAASGVVAFVAADALDVAGLRAALRRRLPAYMVPRSIRVVERLPLNVNGKVDRVTLVRWLEEST
jgi:amino acid adenylation domain-containing protein